MSGDRLDRRSLFRSHLLTWLWLRVLGEFLVDGVSDLFDVGMFYVARNVLPHGVIAVAAVEQLVERCAFCPVLVDDAVHRDDEAGAVSSVLAVQYDGPLGLRAMNC